MSKQKWSQSIHPTSLTVAALTLSVVAPDIAIPVWIIWFVLVVIKPFDL